MSQRTSHRLPGYPRNCFTANLERLLKMKLFRPAVEDSDGGENDDLKAHHVEEGSTRTVLL